MFMYRLSSTCILFFAEQSLLMGVLLLDGLCVSQKDFNVPRDILDEAHKYISPLSLNSHNSLKSEQTEECLFKFIEKYIQIFLYSNEVLKMN
jgi:hypothetical protein